jgi:hypothetical protein
MNCNCGPLKLDFCTSATVSWIKIRIYWNLKLFPEAQLDPDLKIMLDANPDLAPGPKLMGELLPLYKLTLYCK